MKSRIAGTVAVILLGVVLAGYGVLQRISYQNHIRWAMHGYALALHEYDHDHRSLPDVTNWRAVAEEVKDREILSQLSQGLASLPILPIESGFWGGPLRGDVNEDSQLDPVLLGDLNGVLAPTARSVFVQCGVVLQRTADGQEPLNGEATVFVSYADASVRILQVRDIVSQVPSEQPCP